MAEPQLKDGLNIRRTDTGERFVAFAFAAADMVAEVDTDGVVTFAAGAFRSKLGAVPESFVGRPVSDLLVPADREALRTGLAMLSERGRLLPWVVRLANRDRSPMAMAGLRLAGPDRPTRLCLTFSLPPAAPGDIGNAVSSADLARAAEARLRDGAAGTVGLLEIKGVGSSADLSEMVGATIGSLLPDSLTGAVSGDRFGVLPPGNGADSLAQIAARLEAALCGQGLRVSVTSHDLPLAPAGLTRRQAARALRHALTVFARPGSSGGSSGLAEAGFGQGLAGYVNKAAFSTGLLQGVIKARQFGLAFQPIVSLADGELHHYEALLRPQPVPRCGVTAPQEFVELVEVLGLAGELDLAVADLACRAAEKADVSVAFNVSGHSVQDEAFRARLLDRLAGSAAARRHQILVEMTETAEIEDIDQAAQTALALRNMGVAFCLDDFGSGNADFRVLRSLHADIVKLDGSYVPNLPRGGRERALVAGMVEVARGVNAAVVAERVETTEEAEVLRDLGVQYGQGWLFGRPAPLPSRPLVRARRQAAGPEQWA